jgi:hypothetical protein
MDDTPVDDVGNEPSSPLLLLKNQRVIIGKSSVKVVGPRA